jgi:hypothetical protein
MNTQEQLLLITVLSGLVNAGIITYYDPSPIYAFFLGALAATSSLYYAEPNKSEVVRVAHHALTCTGFAITTIKQQNPWTRSLLMGAMAASTAIRRNPTAAPHIVSAALYALFTAQNLLKQ